MVAQKSDEVRKTLRDEAYKYRKTWNVVENKKIKVARLIMSNNLIWNSALLSRKLFCTLKLFTQLLTSSMRHPN